VLGLPHQILNVHELAIVIWTGHMEWNFPDGVGNVQTWIDFRFPNLIFACKVRSLELEAQKSSALILSRKVQDMIAVYAFNLSERANVELEEVDNLLFKFQSICVARYFIHILHLLRITIHNIVIKKFCPTHSKL
jgi:hypothetical protein